jgi:hypothetical protein
MVILAAAAFVYCWEAIPMSSQVKRGSFFYTLLGYFVILIALALIALVIGLGMYWSGFLRLMVSVSEDTAVKWIGFIVYTPVTFWIIVKGSRQRWHNKIFWWTITSVLFIHTALFLAIFRYVEHWKLVYSLVIFMIEGPIILTVSNWTFEKFGREHHSKRGPAHP